MVMIPNTTATSVLAVKDGRVQVRLDQGTAICSGLFLFWYFLGWN